MLANSVSMPRARKSGLTVKKVGDELMVYDIERDKVHCLNPTAALVWEACDGKQSPSAIASRISATLKTRADERVVWYALAQLEKNSLLQDPVRVPVAYATMTRRHFMDKLKIAAIIAVPIIISATAPTPAQASASCGQTGDPCPPFTCCTGFTCVLGACQ